MSISEPFIRRPVATFLLAFALMIAGSAAFTQLPVAPLPRVDFPTINISASLPGAAPQTMASSVATPLERRFGRIAGLNEMTSASTLGTTSITLQFDLDRDVDSAARDVQAAINAAGGDLPPNLPTRPNYRKVNPADSPILIYAIKSKTVPLSTIYDIGNTIFAQKISQVTGVGQVFVGGGQQPAVRVQADPAALAGANLSLEDVRSALGTQTSNSPKGGFGGSDKAQPIVANDQLLDAAAWKDVVISYHNGAPVKLSDVSKVIDSVENERVAGWENGERTVMLIIRRQPGANIIDVIERVKKIVPELARSISPAIDVSVALDRSQTIRASVADVEVSLLISVALVVMVVFLFLRSVWATIIPSVAVPLSLVATFAIMYLLGYSLDNLSLMALTISTGFVVDDAIVVTENVARFIEEGKKPLEAAILGAKQIGFTIVSITISLLAVFIPILLMGGIIGRLFREFAITLSIAIFVSAIVSLTLTPTMCARMLAHAQHERRGRFDRILERGFQALQDGYAKALRFVLRHRVLVGIITIATVTLVVVLLKFFMHFGLFPQQDTGMLAGSTDAPQDISFPAMKERQQALEHVVEADPDVLNAVSFIGGGGGSTGNTGSMFIELKPKPERKTSADDIINRLRPKLAKVQGIQLFLQSVQDVRMGGRSTRSQYQYTLQSADLDQLLKWAPKMLVALRKIKILQDVNTDQQTAGLELDINVDRDTAARMGISMRDVDNTIYDAFGQRQVATTFTSVNQYRVVLEIKPALARGPESLAQLYVRSSTGNQVPLSAIASFTPAVTPLSVNHQGQFPSVTLSFNAGPGISLSQAVAAIHEVEGQLGLPASVHGDFTGTAQAYKDSLASEKWLIIAALITVYIVLGMLYESYIHPITILSTLPSAGVGALLALLLFNMDLSIIGIVGIILLIGIVKKNAIMMIDFALEKEREGATPEESIYQACLLRFRPILMTTMAALLGGLPLALGNGTGAEMRRPLGVAIVGGLMLSQMLTLFTTPVTYLFLDRFRSKKEHVPPAAVPINS
ncbi:MAG TPA: multidrug efflux RND transporter permease subunit [Polyangia bacterium]|nr:multidrug efflux RND transporter permease subunit [Polyangia bacterium]